MSRTYLELVDGSSAKFWEIVVDGCEHTVRYGRIGAAGRATTKTFDSSEEAESKAAKLIASKRKKGYAAPSVVGEAISFEALAEEFPEVEERGDAFFEMAERAYVFRGDVTSDDSGILGIADELGDEGTVIVILGDYTCTAELVDWGDRAEFSNNVVFVMGDMTTNHLFLNDIGMLVVKGSLKAKSFFGAQGDNGGSLDVCGDLVADYVIGASYFIIGVEGEVRVKYQLGDSTYASDYADKKALISLGDAALFVDELSQEYGEVDEWELHERLVAGRPIFVNDGKPREGVYEKEW